MLRQPKAAGRYSVLATAADRRVAEAIAAHLRIFNEVIASDGTRNLNDEAKARVLVDRFGVNGFCYPCNARLDLAIADHPPSRGSENHPPNAPGLVLRLAAPFGRGPWFPIYGNI